MKFIKRFKILIHACFFICLMAEVNAQEIWTKIDADTFELNTALLNASLAKASKKNNTTVTIQFPDQNGKLTPFQVFDNALLPESLALKYPNIHAYKGISIENPELSITLTCRSRGIAGTLIKGTKISLLEQLENTNIYIISNDSSATNVRASCSNDESEMNSSGKSLSGITTSNQSLIGDNTLRIFRTAIIATGEYSTYFTRNLSGLTSEDSEKDAVLGAITTSLNNINTVFERDLGIRFELIDNNDDLIFLDPNTDPFFSNIDDDIVDTGSQQISNIIGLDNIDIGHVFHGESAGLAGLSILCSNRKAEGVSGSITPERTGFDFTLLAHEFGHQLGANHTQNFICARNSSTSVEPGGGSTIMGYAGITCENTSTDIQNLSDEYFHIVSINQIKNHLQFASCGIESMPVTNNNPVIEPLSNYTIPAGTNFTLEANVTDADNDSLTYSWEQTDNEVEEMPPVSTSFGGPLFRSMIPSSSPSRNFPETYNTNTTWEVLPTVSREMNFGLTVRDGKAGGIATDNLTVSVVDTGEQFEVTAPTGGSSPQNSIIQIAWNVAGTNSNGIDTEFVNIALSYDNGLTFPVILTENTPNDGEQDIIVPVGQATDEARIRITPVNNIYYTISDIPFSITEEIDDDLGAIPNPVEKEILIKIFKLQVAQFQFTLHDMYGHLLISKTITSNTLFPETEAVDISNLANGMYILKIILGSQIHTRKVIKE